MTGHEKRHRASGAVSLFSGRSGLSGKALPAGGPSARPRFPGLSIILTKRESLYYRLTVEYPLFIIIVYCGGDDMPTSYSVRLEKIVAEHELTVAYRATDYDRVCIDNWDVSRPALPLAGFYDYFDAGRVQVIGKLEITYLSEMSAEARAMSGIYDSRVYGFVPQSHLVGRLLCITYGSPLSSDRVLVPVKRFE